MTYSTLDDLARALVELRVRAGSPPYAAIGREVTRARLARGVPEGEARVHRSTVYDAFRTGRRRVDATLVADIAAALGGSRQQWLRACRETQGRADAAGVVGLRSGPAAIGSFVGRRDELDEIERWAEDPDVRLVVISGMAGVGKTWLAETAAARLCGTGRRRRGALVPPGRRLGPRQHRQPPRRGRAPRRGSRPPPDRPGAVEGVRRPASGGGDQLQPGRGPRPTRAAGGGRGAARPCRGHQPGDRRPVPSRVGRPGPRSARPGPW